MIHHQHGLYVHTCTFSMLKQTQILCAHMYIFDAYTRTDPTFMYVHAKILNHYYTHAQILRAFVHDFDACLYTSTDPTFTYAHAHVRGHSLHAMRKHRSHMRMLTHTCSMLIQSHAHVRCLHNHTHMLNTYTNSDLACFHGLQAIIINWSNVQTVPTKQRFCVESVSKYLMEKLEISF